MLIDDGLLTEMASRIAAGQGTSRLGDTLDAINQRRVDALLIEEHLVLPGVRCPACGWLGPTGATCSFDGYRTVQRSNLVEELIDATLAQSGRVLVYPAGTRHAPPSGIAAVLTDRSSVMARRPA